jgi:3-oxoacyl-[acyl-carrier-protein] synthase II
MAEAIAASIVSTLQRSTATVKDVGHFNAHGFSTVEDDIHEALGIHKALGDVPVIAPKSSFGNVGPGTGAIELAASIHACQTGILPPALNVDAIDERCPINLVTGDGVTADKRSAITINFTEAGQLATLMIAL